MRVNDMKSELCGWSWMTAVCICLCAPAASAQHSPVTVQVEIVKRKAEKKETAARSAAGAANVVVWLVPLDGMSGDRPGTASARPSPRLLQRNKSFEPHLLVVEAGASVQFPNQDPFFHNVFSLFDGKRFDLGLYEAGTTKSLRFDRPGVSYLFCNIHPEMSAVVVAVDTPYFAVSDRAGHVAIPDVPDGRYRMRVWFERSSPEDLKSQERVVTVSESARALETIRVMDIGSLGLAHKNKYGQDYLPPAGPGYKRP